jgi:hypothetical protein
MLFSQALKISQNASGAEQHLKCIRQSTRLVTFFATPHGGTDLASWGELLARIGGLFKVTNTKLYSALNAQNDNGQLEELRYEFNKMLGPTGGIRAVTFRETKPPLSIRGTPASRLVIHLKFLFLNLR